MIYVKNLSVISGFSVFSTVTKAFGFSVSKINLTESPYTVILSVVCTL